MLLTVRLSDPAVIGGIVADLSQVKPVTLPFAAMFDVPTAELAVVDFSPADAEAK